LKTRRNVRDDVRGFDFDFDFNILTALKDWVGLAPKGPGALHIYQHCALHIIILYFDAGYYILI
jgi:hypothetical protein